MATDEVATEYEFGPFRLDAARRALYRGAEFVPLTPKAAEMLLLLVEEAGRVVTKEQILQRAWPGVVVEEGTIANNVSTLRKVLDPAFAGEGPIATVARRGYRFSAPVRVNGNGSAAVRAAIPASAPAPRLTDRDTVLMGDIENKTGDAVFDGTLKQALLLHLAQSPLLQILSDRKVRTALQMMQRPSDTPAVGEVALEICQRTGARAAITGSIHVLGDDYVIGLVALDGESGDIMCSEQARAQGKGQVLKALDGAAQSLREKLGESLASVTRLSLSLDSEVTTTSLEALKAYAMARRQWLERGDAAGIPYQEQALALDPNFASAHSALAIALSNLGQTKRSEPHMRKAYELRDRVTERERRRLEATYHLIVTGDVHRSLDANSIALKNYPRDGTLRGNSGNLRMMLGQWDLALELSESAMQIDPTNVIASAVALCQMALGRHEDARRTLELSFARGIDAYYMRLDAYHEAFLRGDDEAMRRHFDLVAGRAGEEDFLIAAQADTEAFFGRLPRSRELSARAAESALKAGSPEMSAAWTAQWAMREAELGFGERAIELADAALERSDGRAVRSVAAYALARAGDRTVVETVVSELDAAYPADTMIQHHWLPCTRAAAALGRGDASAALRAIEPAESMELSLIAPFEGGFMLPAYLRGLAHAAAGRHEDAVRELAKIEARPGLVKNYITYPLALRALAASRNAAL
jgi:DNA-binding winged helix-turn-helix (wHTH) protein/tetratricopeptide (TPR) repeat protein